MEERWVEVRGAGGRLRLHTLVDTSASGEGVPDVVLVHGAAVAAPHMLPTARLLADRCRVWVPELPGHGRSDDPAEVLDVRGHADTLASWMDQVGLGRAVFLGNSYGCQVIVELAVRHPERVERAVLQGPTVDPAARTFPRQLGRWLVNAVREGSTQPSETFRQWAQAGARVGVLTVRDMHRDRIEAKLPQVAAPTLVVRGSRDAIVPQRWAERATQLLPRGRLVVVPGQTHTMTVAAPEELVEAVLPFVLGEVPPSG